MKNAVSPFAGSQQTTDLAARLQAIKKAAPKSSDGSIYLKMGKDGIWQFGASNEEPEKGDRWAVNPFSVKIGFICWSTDENHGGGPLGEVMYDNPNDVEPISAMATVVDGRWTNQMQVSLQCLTEPNDGLDVVFKVNSVGGLQTINNIVDAIMSQASKQPALIVPIIELDNSYYIHKVKKYGKIYTPVLDIVDWMTIEGGSSSEQIEEEKPARRRYAPPEEPAAEEVEKDAAPVRRRRRS